jgi:uncharacterized protein (UPF0332 family)
VTPLELLSKAERALVSAELLLLAGDPDGASNRAYYAMFDAARAGLLCVTPESQAIKTHNGLISAFSQQLVKPGHIPLELGRALNTMEDMRIAADYRSLSIEADSANWAVMQARVFVAAVREFVTENPSSRPLP